MITASNCPTGTALASLSVLPYLQLLILLRSGFYQLTVISLVPVRRKQSYSYQPGSVPPLFDRQLLIDVPPRPQ